MFESKIHRIRESFCRDNYIKSERTGEQSDEGYASVLSRRLLLLLLLRRLLLLTRTATSSTSAAFQWASERDAQRRAVRRVSLARVMHLNQANYSIIRRRKLHECHMTALSNKLEALNLQSQISEERANILFGSSRYYVRHVQDMTWRKYVLEVAHAAEAVQR